MSYAFISGATGGIGKAFTKELASMGNDLFLTGRSQDKLNALKDEIILSYHVKVEVYPCDLVSEDERNKMVLYIESKSITFNKIINVAGVDIQKPFMDYTKEKVLKQIRVNAESTICLTHSLLKLKADSCEVVTISSMSGASPMPYFALYSATKAMLINFYKSLHIELKKDNVKVTVVMPGGVYTRPDVIKDIKGQGLWGKLSAKTPEFVAKKSLKAVKRNKKLLIPGFFNKFLYHFMKIVPESIKLKFIANRWKKQTKDAF